MALLNKAVEDGVIHQNPIKGWKRLSEPTDERVRYLEPDERDRFMVALGFEPLYFQTFVKLALLTGLRRGELLQLTWAHIDMKLAQITVRAGTAKSNKKRFVPCPSAAMDVLRVWRQKQKVIDTSRYLFMNPATGKPYYGIKRRWASVCKVASIENFRFHDCRHDYASRLVQKGADLYKVKELLGHSSFELTQRYAHLSDESKREVVELLS